LIRYLSFEIRELKDEDLKITNPDHMTRFFEKTPQQKEILNQWLKDHSS